MSYARKEMEAYIEKVFDVRKVNNNQSKAECIIRICSKQDGSLIRDGESMKWHLSHRFFTFEYGFKNRISEVYRYGDKMLYGYSEATGRWHVWNEKGDIRQVFQKGYKVRKGGVAYEPPTKELFIERALRFWQDSEIYQEVTVENETDESFDIVCVWSSDPKIVKSEIARGGYTSHRYNFPKEYGKGEWQANTKEELQEVALAYLRNITR